MFYFLQISHGDWNDIRIHALIVINKESMKKIPEKNRRKIHVNLKNRCNSKS